MTTPTPAQAADKMAEKPELFDPSASHIPPDWRDGWNAALKAAAAYEAERAQPATLSATFDDATKAVIKAAAFEVLADKATPDSMFGFGAGAGWAIDAIGPPPVVQAVPTREDLIAALDFYAKREHFIVRDSDAWDTVNGEPENYWCHEYGTATVEDGTLARLTLAGEMTAAHFAALGDDDEPTPQPKEQPSRAAQAVQYRLLESSDRIQADDEFLAEDCATWRADPGRVFVGARYQPGSALRVARRKVAQPVQPTPKDPT